MAGSDTTTVLITGENVAEKGVASGQSAAARSEKVKGETLPSGAASTPPRVWPVWLLLLCAGWTLYALTAQRSIGWQDSGYYQLRAIDGEIHTDLALATDHPLYILVGHLLSLPNPRLLPLLLNIFTGLGSAIALANLGGLLLGITKERWIAILTPGMLAVCHTLWWLSTVAEVYTWVIAGLTTELWLLYHLLRCPHWKLVAGLAFVSGVGLCIHNMALLPLPIYVLVTLALVRTRRLPVRALAIGALAWVAGSAYYLALVVLLAIREGSFQTAVMAALFGGWSGHVVGTVPPNSALLKVNLGIIALNFMNLLLPLTVVGWLNFRSTLGGLGSFAFASITLVEVVFVSRYFVADQFTFLLPTLVMVALAAGIGLHVLAVRGRRWKRVLIGLCCLAVVSQPALFAAAPAVVKKMGIDTSRDRPLKCRDEARYWLVPWKHDDDSAFRWAYEVLEWASRGGGILLADSTTANALIFVQRYWNVGSSVSLVDRGGLPDFRRDMAGFRRAVGERPLYALSDSPGYLRGRFGPLAKATRAEKEGPLYRLWWLPPSE